MSDQFQASTLPQISRTKPLSHSSFVETTKPLQINLSLLALGSIARQRILSEQTSSSRS